MRGDGRLWIRSCCSYPLRRYFQAGFLPVVALFLHHWLFSRARSAPCRLAGGRKRAPFRIHIIYTALSRISASLLQRIQLRIYGFCALENTLPYKPQAANGDPTLGADYSLMCASASIPLRADLSLLAIQHSRKSMLRTIRQGKLNVRVKWRCIQMLGNEFSAPFEHEFWINCWSAIKRCTRNCFSITNACPAFRLWVKIL